MDDPLSSDYLQLMLDLAPMSASRSSQQQFQLQPPVHGNFFNRGPRVEPWRRVELWDLG
jgi:hypothetical protein